MNKKVIILLSVMMACLITPGFKCICKNQQPEIKITTAQNKLVDCINSKMYEVIPRSFNYKINNVVSKMNQEMDKTNYIQDKKEWFIEYKNIVEKYKYILDPPETLYDYFTEEELNLLFHVVQAEVGDEYSFEQKVNVASVIFNRIEHNNFEDTISDVILSENQFQVISDGRYQKVKVSDTTILACEYAFMIENTAQGCLFFDRDKKLKYKFVWNDGIHNFYTIKE